MTGGAKLLAFPQAPEAIEFRHLRSFVAVAEELNFGRAAERLYISQPALSRQIRALEQLVGCDLLRRTTHWVELTLAGEALLDRARKLLHDVDEAVAATQSVGGELAARVAKLWGPVVAGVFDIKELHATREAYEQMTESFPVPPEVEIRPVNANGVPSLLVSADLAQPPTLLFLHGGGSMMGSAIGCRTLAGALAVAADSGALVPDYRLAPEHTHPAPIEDAASAFGWMLDRGVDPAQVIVIGDSAGGGLVVSLLVWLKLQRLPLPGSAVLLCPWVDVGLELEQEEPLDDERRMGIELTRHFAEIYLDGHPVDDPVVSPLQADLTGLGALLIQAATGDGRLPDARALADHARRHGVDARLELYPVDAHVFQLFWSFLPEAMDALGTAGRFAREIRARPPASERGRSAAAAE